jgi:cell filamentation protein
MYAAIADPYCVIPARSSSRIGSGCATRPNWTPSRRTSTRADEDLPPGRLGYRHYRAIHRHLFQDLYSWAGRIRNIRIAKGGNAFCYPEHIDREMKRLFADLKKREFLRGLGVGEFAEGAAYFLAEVNAIHPFREGNGRTQLSFLQILAERAGHSIVWSVAAHAAILNATVRSFGGDERPLARIIRGLARRRPE